ncbi:MULTISPECIES: glycosyltransferase [Halomonadaceae]|uniref:glycosyltransferase n=1 Tax=Halomonadaceae TaxID=28256 RepID=UPI00159A4BEB|nr:MULTISPECIES: glycosyltransferase [Halomonas]QJQ94006.1 glycosyltransferase [Halomonas sp. PA5]
MRHVTGLLDRNVDVHVLANREEEAAWESLGNYEQKLHSRIFHYQLPVSKKARLQGALRLTLKNMANGRYSHLKSWNLFRFNEKSHSLVFPYLYNTALDIGPVDILHCHFGRNGTFGSYLKKLGLVKKLVVTFHGYDVSSVLKTSGSKHPYQSLFEEADLLLPVSERWKQKLLELGAPEDRIQVHRVGIDVDHFNFCERYGKTKPLKIATTARFTEKKGIKYAVEAIALVRENNPALKIHYDLIGNGPLWKEIKSLVTSLGLLDCIKLHGALPHQKVQALLGQADIFMLPSVTAENGDQEGIPVSLMEAMASGMPVLSTIHSGIPELIEEGVSGYLVPERNSEALAERIIYLSRNSHDWKRMGKAGRTKIDKDYNINMQNAKLLDLYKELLVDRK